MTAQPIKTNVLSVQDHCSSIILGKNNAAKVRTLHEKTNSVAKLLSELANVQTEVRSLKPRSKRGCGCERLECLLIEKISYSFAWSEKGEVFANAVAAHIQARNVLQTTEEELQRFAIQETETLVKQPHLAVEKLALLEKLMPLSQDDIFVKQQLADCCLQLNLYDEAKKYFQELAETQNDTFLWQEKFIAISLGKGEYQQAQRDGQKALAEIERIWTLRSLSPAEFEAFVEITKHLSKAFSKLGLFSSAITQLSALLARFKFSEEKTATLRKLIINYHIEEALLAAKSVYSVSDIRDRRIFSQALFEYTKEHPQQKATQAEFSFWIHLYQHFPVIQELPLVKTYIQETLTILALGKSQNLEAPEVTSIYARTVIDLRETVNDKQNYKAKALSVVTGEGNGKSKLLQAAKKKIERGEESHNDVTSEEQGKRLQEIRALFKSTRLLQNSLSWEKFDDFSAASVFEKSDILQRVDDFSKIESASKSANFSRNGVLQEPHTAALPPPQIRAVAHFEQLQSPVVHQCEASAPPSTDITD